MIKEKSISIPDIEEFEPEIVTGNEALLAPARIWVRDGIKTKEDRGKAWALGKSIKTLGKRRKMELDEFKEPVMELWRGFNDLAKRLIAPLKVAEASLAATVAKFDKEEQDRLEIEREKNRIAEEKRQKFYSDWSEAIAEENRRILAAHEAEKKAQEEAEKAERDRQIKADEDARLAQAEASKEAGGSDDRAAQILEKPGAIVETPKAAPIEKPKLIEDAPAPAPLPTPAALVPATSQDSGMKGNRRYKARIVDPLTVLRGIVKGEIPIEAVEIKLPFFNKGATTHREKYQIKVDGVLAVDSFPSNKASFV